jgi:hypothetical protein
MSPSALIAKIQRLCGVLLSFGMSCMLVEWWNGGMLKRRKTMKLISVKGNK